MKYLPVRNCICIAAVLFISSGCFLHRPQTLTRDCPGFDYPDVKKWQPLQLGSTVVFTNTDGNSFVYVLDSITDSEPYVATGSLEGEDREPLCEITSFHAFLAEDNSHEIIMKFAQGDFDTLDPSQDTVWLKIIVSLPGSLEELSTSTWIDLAELQAAVDFDETDVTFFPSKTLENGQTYTDVIQSTGNLRPELPEYAQWVINEFLLARDKGLIQIARADGTVLTVIPDQ